jgi:tripartite-type tricarboxylate transporter receptor subunit TctC
MLAAVRQATGNDCGACLERTVTDLRRHIRYDMRFRKDVLGAAAHCREARRPDGSTRSVLSVPPEGDAAGPGGSACGLTHGSVGPRIRRTCCLLLASLALVGLAYAAANGAEDPVAAFYRGKTVRILVGFAAGGGFDLYSRVIARHLRGHIPGNPVVVVENWPGAGSMVAANHVFRAAPRDGTVIGNLSGPIALEQVFGSAGVEFDMAQFRPLAVPASDAFVLIAARSASVTRFDELRDPRRRPLIVGAVPGSTITHASFLVRDLLGARMKVVVGYKGTAELRLAVDGGEIEAFFISWNSARALVLERLRSGEWVILAQLADAPLPGLPGSPIPTIAELTPDESQRRLLRLGTVVPNVIGKLYVLAPEVPADRGAAMEAAFRHTLADPAFLADAAQAGLEIRPRYAVEIRRLIRELLAMPPELTAMLRTRTRDPAR